MAAISSSFVLWNCARHSSTRSQIDEKFGVVKAAGIGAVVGTADLADNLLHLGKPRKHEPRALFP